MLFIPLLQMEKVLLGVCKPCQGGGKGGMQGWRAPRMVQFGHGSWRSVSGFQMSCVPLPPATAGFPWIRLQPLLCLVLLIGVKGV